MRELERVHRALSAAAERGEAAVVVTVLGVEGSVYRGAGARMVVSSSGECTGAVSGGCLEADIVARSPEILASGRPEVAHYDTRASDDVVLGLGLGCQGVIDVLMEPHAGEALTQAIAFYRRLAAHRVPVVMHTLVRDFAGEAIGARYIAFAGGDRIEGNAELLAAGAEVVTEIVTPAVPLVICGGGNDAIPLARLAKLLGWHVTVVDHRSSFASRERFPDADVIVCANLTQGEGGFPETVTVDDRTIAVCMAHSATHDRACLHALLDARARYIGVLGPRRRTLELLGDRSTEGDIPPTVHSPVGLDIGAESPEEIALAIVAEVAAVTRGRAGGMLRERVGPIHERRAKSDSLTV